MEQEKSGFTRFLESSGLETNLNDGRGHNQGTKRKVDDSDDDEPADEVRLWESGFKDRYYESKFDVDKDSIAFRYEVGNQYVRGLCWVMKYYYQGCASWEWYFPYHYAPFASDFLNVADVDVEFPLNTKPVLLKKNNINE